MRQATVTYHRNRRHRQPDCYADRHASIRALLRAKMIGFAEKNSRLAKGSFEQFLDGFASGFRQIRRARASE